MSSEHFAVALGDFVKESNELLASVRTNLVNLKQSFSSPKIYQHGTSDSIIVDEIFRAVHTMHGLSAFMGLSDMHTVTRHLEKVFHAVRHNTCPLNDEVVGLVFRAVDRLQEMLQSLANGDRASIYIEDLIEAINEALGEAHSPYAFVPSGSGLALAQETLDAADELRVEKLFELARDNRSKACELKRSLDSLGVFTQYEDRFLDLFSKSESGAIE